MESCDNCVMLNDELWHANRHYVSLLLQQDRLSKGCKEKARTMEAISFEAAIQRAKSVRASAARDLVVHRAGHVMGSRIMARTAVLVLPLDREAGRPFRR